MSGVTITRNSMDGKDYGGALDRAIEASLTKAGIIVERAAVGIAGGFVQTGRLRGSITYKTAKSGSHASGAANADDEVSKPTDKWTVHVGSNVEYAAHVEYGTVRRAKTPYLRPALQNNKQAIMRDFGKWVEEALRRGK